MIWLYIPFLIITFLFLYFWIKEFTFLMALSDEDFSGKNDKVLWFATFVLLFILAPLLFRLWRNTVLTKG